MHLKKHIFIILYLFVCVISINGQKKCTEININFRVNSTVIDPTYMSNAERLDELIEYIAKLHQDTTLYVTQVTFMGVASPEGSYQVNKRLAKGRMAALENYIRSRIQIPENIVIRDSETYIPWNYLIAEVEKSDLPLKDEILSILHGDSQLVPYNNGKTIDNRVIALKKMDNGRIWSMLNKYFFPKMRNACLVFITLKDLPRQLPLVETKSIFLKGISNQYTTQLKQDINNIPEAKEWSRNMYLKINTIGVALAIANIAVEIDLAQHWSFTLPIYYSAWDYFKSTIKFRTLAFQPEFRYWLSKKNDGFFTGAHLGLAYYNFALDGTYRYQDHHRRTPAIGGGFNVGYRTPISKNQRWKMEFSIGGGVYPLNYDKFYNTTQTKDGLMIGSVKKTYWGVDQAIVSLSYTLNLQKKGGIR